MVAKFIPITNPKIKALIPLALGLIIANLKIARNKFIRDAATGSMAIGTISLVKQFLPQLPLLAGAESAESIVSSLRQLPKEQQALLGIEPGSTETLVGSDGLATVDSSVAESMIS
jgi:hypothetical protein